MFVIVVAYIIDRNINKRR